MALPASSLSVICKSIADYLSSAVQSDPDKLNVLIGTPAAAAANTPLADEHNLNLFFHRFEPSGFGPGAAPGELWQLRLFCMITAFCSTTGGPDRIDAGENDLRLLGQVLRLFHETPVLPAVDVQGETVRLQVVFLPLGPEEINHLWSTQGDAAYRPSLAYEMALTPVVSSKLSTGGPLVGAVGSDVRATMAAQRDPFQGSAARPPVEPSTVDVRRIDWNPRICFVFSGVCVQSLAFDLDDPATPDLQALKLAVWAAGDATVDVDLRWEVWHAGTGWETVPASVTKTKPITEGIDPAQVPTAGLVQLGLPFHDTAGQAVLYAVHKYRMAGDTSERESRSNPLLITLYGTVV